MLKFKVAALFGVNALVAPLVAAGVTVAATPAFADPDPQVPCWVIDITCDRTGHCTVSDAQADPDCDGDPG